MPRLFDSKVHVEVTPGRWVWLSEREYRAWLDRNQQEDKRDKRPQYR